MEKLNRWRKRKLHPTKFLTNLGQMWSLKLVGAIVWKNQRLHQRIIVTIEYYLRVNNQKIFHFKTLEIWIKSFIVNYHDIIRKVITSKFNLKKIIKFCQNKESLYFSGKFTLSSLLEFLQTNKWK